MIVECSTSSQAKSAGRPEEGKRSLFVVWVSQEFLKSWERRIHSLIHTFTRPSWGVPSLSLHGCHGMPLLCIYRA